MQQGRLRYSLLRPALGQKSHQEQNLEGCVTVAEESTKRPLADVRRSMPLLVVAGRLMLAGGAEFTASAWPRRTSSA
jgi:hypothetical protein